MDPQPDPDDPRRPRHRRRRPGRPPRPPEDVPPRAHPGGGRGRRDYGGRTARPVPRGSGGPWPAGRGRRALPAGLDGPAARRHPARRARQGPGPHDDPQHAGDRLRPDPDRGHHPGGFLALRLPADGAGGGRGLLPRQQGEVHPAPARADALRLHGRRAGFPQRGPADDRDHAGRRGQPALAGRARAGRRGPGPRRRPRADLAPQGPPADQLQRPGHPHRRRGRLPLADALPAQRADGRLRRPLCAGGAGPLGYGDRHAHDRARAGPGGCRAARGQNARPGRGPPPRPDRHRPAGARPRLRRPRLQREQPDPAGDRRYSGRGGLLVHEPGADGGPGRHTPRAARHGCGPLPPGG